MNTKVIPVDSTSITFQPSSSCNEHPFEDPKVLIHSKETEIALEEASSILHQKDGIVAFPTETVYGLGADARKSEAVLNIYKAKNRPADNPLITHIGSLKQLSELIDSTTQKNKLKGDSGLWENIPLVYKPLIDRYWPGPMSILLPIEGTEGSPVSKVVTAGQSTFAVRMPEHPVALALILKSKAPLAAPSANASTRPSPTLAAHVFHDLNGKLPLILDGGPCGVGLESTVVNGLCDPPVILRPGGISLEDIQSCGGVWSRTVVYKPTDDVEKKSFVPQTPGMKYRHYSPTAKVLLFEGMSEAEANDILQNDYLHANQNTKPPKIGVLTSCRWNVEKFSDMVSVSMCLGRTGKEIRRNLFSMIRDMDEKQIDIILVEGVESDHEGLAIMNRLGKAASAVYRSA